MFSGGSRSCTGVSFFNVPQTGGVGGLSVKAEKGKKGNSYLILVKINVYLPDHNPSHGSFGDFPLYCKASKLNLESNDFIVHVSAIIISQAGNIKRAVMQPKCVKCADFCLVLFALVRSVLSAPFSSEFNKKRRGLC